MSVLDRFMAGLNQYDAQAMDAAMHFPYVREDDWKYSRWVLRELVQCSDIKAHYALSYTWFRSDDSVIGVYESLFVLTKVDGSWGIQMRSSFGP